jgi:hypothetical protein
MIFIPSIQVFVKIRVMNWRIVVFIVTVSEVLFKMVHIMIEVYE